MAVVTGAASGIGKGIADGVRRRKAPTSSSRTWSTEDGAAEVLDAIARRTAARRCSCGPMSATRRSVRAHGRARRSAGSAGSTSWSTTPASSPSRCSRTCRSRTGTASSARNLRGMFLCTRVLIGQMLERRRRPDHQHRLAARPDRRRRGGPLLGQQGRGHRVDQGAGPRGARRVACCVNAIAPGPDPDAAAGRRDRGVAQRQARRAAHRPLRRGRRGRARRRCCWPPPTARTTSGQTLAPNGGDVML